MLLPLFGPVSEAELLQVQGTDVAEPERLDVERRASPTTLSAAWIPVRRAQSQWGKAISP